MTSISSRSPYEKSFLEVLGKRMAYVDVGSGDPIIFLHGNPTSSYLWRNIMPHLDGQGRLIAPDLIGMGDSEKLENSGHNSYSFIEHRKYLFELLRVLGLEKNVTLVLHDWGSALGFDWAFSFPNAVRGIAFMEAFVAPLTGWDMFPERARETFQKFRSSEGENMILKHNAFVERVLPGSVIRGLTEEEMLEYRRPFETAGESRRPTLTWPRQIPIGGAPESVHQIVSNYSKWLRQTEFPKLFVNVEPGAMTSDSTRDVVRSWKAVSEVTVKGLHFVPEDSPHEIGQAVSTWLKDSFS